MLNLQNKTIVFCLTLFFCFFFSPLAFGQGKTEWLNDKVTLRFQEEPMSSVLGKLSEQTGIAILYDEKLAGQKVTGLYKDIKFAEAINRLFSETNKSIQVLKNEKKIIVKTFGAKNFVLALSAQSAPVSEFLDKEKSMTVADLNKLHKEQYEEYLKSIKNANIVIPGINLTRGELDKINRKQYDEYLEKKNNENIIVPGSNTTLKELNKLNSEQYLRYKRTKNDHNAISPGSGITRRELNDLNKKQYQEMKASVNNLNQKIPGMEKTRGELNDLNKKQYQEMKAKKADL